MSGRQQLRSGSTSNATSDSQRAAVVPATRGQGKRIPVLGDTESGAMGPRSVR
jgi:hypothetical protein